LLDDTATPSVYPNVAPHGECGHGGHRVRRVLHAPLTAGHRRVRPRAKGRTKIVPNMACARAWLPASPKWVWAPIC